MVLNGENLGRSEQCRLPAGIDDTEHCAKGDNRLAAPHIPLHEPVHRVAGSEVNGNLLADLDLAPGQRERQMLIEGALQASGRAGSRQVKDANVSFVGASAPIVTGTTFIFVREPY